MENAVITEEQKKAALKPCPFCGRKAVYEKTVCDNLVKCDWCFATVSQRNSVDGSIERCSITSWNTRAPINVEAVPQEVVEALEELLSVPMWLDQATVSPCKTADDQPEQAVVNMSVSWGRILKARKALVRLRGEG